MATFLQMVNRTLQLLRHEAVTTLAGADDPAPVVMETVNRNARTLLEQRIWSFLIRDHQITVNPVVSGTAAIVAADGSMAIPEADIEDAVFADGFTRWYVEVSEDPTYGTTAFPIVSFRTGFGAHVPTGQDGDLFPLAEGTGLSYKLFPNVRRFPANVRKILSAKHQAQSIEIFQESRMDLNADLPDWHREEDSAPRSIFIGGLTSPTFHNLVPTEQVYGPRMLIWPAPTQQLVIDLDVVWRHDVLAEDADVLTGVPEHICDLIVIRSAVDGLLGQVVADPVRGNSLRSLYEDLLGDAIAAEQEDPARRRILRPFGSASRELSRGSRSRWASQLIPSP